MINSSKANEDLYSGYNEFNPLLDTKSIAYDNDFQQAIMRSSYGNRTRTGRLGTGRLGTGRFELQSRAAGFGRAMSRGFSRAANRRTSETMPVTAGSKAPTARPMTAVRAAGYSSTGAGWGASFDPLNQATRMGSAFHHKDENSVENRLKALWQRVLSLYEESVRAAQAGQAKLALDKAKECASKERTWSKHVLAGPTAIGASLTGSSNASAALELKLAVQVNLAAQYVRNGILSEAIRVYANICRNKQLPNAGRFRCNIGCILYAQGEYVPAIKMFRMALDQMPASNRLARLNIMRNIGFTFVRLNQFAEASGCFDYVLQERAGTCTDAFHQLVCQTWLADTVAMQSAFVRLLELASRSRFESSLTGNTTAAALMNDSDDSDSDDDLEPELILAQPDEPDDLNDLLRRDVLAERARARRSAQQWQVLSAAQLIAPRLNTALNAGFQWCERQVAACFSDTGARFDSSVDTTSATWTMDSRTLLQTIGNRRAAELLGRLELARAERLLQSRQLNDAAQVLSQFERLDGVRELAGAAADRSLRSVRAAALTNLSFVCLVSAKHAEAEQHAQAAQALDPTHVGALVNAAAARLSQDQVVDAKPLLQEALLQDANCVPALFNLALCNRRLGRLQDALRLLLRINSLISSHEYVLYQLAQTYEQLGEVDQAVDVYQQLAHILQSDVGLLNKLSDLAEAQQDKQQSLAYLNESHRYFPANIDTLERLAAFHIESQVYEKAITYLEKAVQVQPSQIKWQLMVGACHRRTGNLHQAYSSYLTALDRFPDSEECVRHLIRLSLDLRLHRQHSEFTERLQKMQKIRQMREKRTQSAFRTANGSRENSASSSSASSSVGHVRSTAGGVSNTRPSTSSIRPDSSISGLIRSNDLNVELSDWSNSMITNDRPTSGYTQSRPRTSRRRTSGRDEDDLANEDLASILAL